MQNHSRIMSSEAEIKDLSPLFDMNSLECLNQDSSHVVTNCMKQVHHDAQCLCSCSVVKMILLSRDLVTTMQSFLPAIVTSSS